MKKSILIIMLFTVLLITGCEKKKEDIKPKGQVVDIAKPKIEKKPSKSRFLSERAVGDEADSIDLF